MSATGWTTLPALSRCVPHRHFPSVVMQMKEQIKRRSHHALRSLSVWSLLSVSYLLPIHHEKKAKETTHAWDFIIFYLMAPTVSSFFACMWVGANKIPWHASGTLLLPIAPYDNILWVRIERWERSVHTVNSLAALASLTRCGHSLHSLLFLCMPHPLHGSLRSQRHAKKACSGDGVAWWHVVNDRTAHLRYASVAHWHKGIAAPLIILLSVVTILGFCGAAWVQRRRHFRLNDSPVGMQKRGVSGVSCFLHSLYAWWILEIPLIILDMKKTNVRFTHAAQQKRMAWARLQGFLMSESLTCFATFQ